MWRTESKLRSQGYSRIAGIDEAGRGPLAGPVMAAAVVLPGPKDKGYRTARKTLENLGDSKQVPPERRVLLAEAIIGHAIAWGVGEADVDDIDRLNILQASFVAMRRALLALERSFPGVVVDTAIVDGHLAIPDLSIRQYAIIRGDALCAAISAASILAKVHRDRLMCDLHRQYPEYGFDRHKGYPTPEHLSLLIRFGPCPVHRRTFGPVQRSVPAARIS